MPARKSRTLSGDRLDRLLAAIGKGHLNPFESLELKEELREIEKGYRDRRGQITIKQRRALRKFRAYTAKRRELRKQFAPIKYEIVIAGWLRDDPEADEAQLRALMHDPDGIEIPDFAKTELNEDRAIGTLLDNRGDYRKREIRKLVVEPFLRFLVKHNIEPSPRQLPLSRMIETLFDWLEIELRHRPTGSGIRTIKREL